MSSKKAPWQFKLLAGLCVAGLLLAGCTAGTTSHRTTTVPAGALTLVAFDSCDDLLNGLRAAAKNTATSSPIRPCGRKLMMNEMNM